jgi:hypothetical protein
MVCVDLDEAFIGGRPQLQGQDYSLCRVERRPVQKQFTIPQQRSHRTKVGLQARRKPVNGFDPACNSKPRPEMRACTAGGDGKNAHDPTFGGYMPFVGQRTVRVVSDIVLF